ncbi:MAG: glycosyltransferase [Chthoniobacter sp.]|nr:glycosyltransferase [Chthoniobacter sp.]
MHDWIVIAGIGAAIFPGALSVYLIVTACVQVLWRESSRPAVTTSKRSVTVVVPAHNEERTIGGCLEALVASTHADLKICVVSDGSTDATAEIARSFVSRGVELRELAGNTGKSAALDAALADVTTELVLVIDADTHVAPDAIGDLAAAFDDPQVGAATANIRVRGEHGLLARMQAVEYASIIGLLKRSNGLWGGLFTVSGAAACYRVEALRKCGGFLSNSVAEDIELSWRMQRAGWRLDYVPEASASVEVPARWRDLWQQRVRWSRGMVEVLRAHGNGWTTGRSALAIFTVESVCCMAWAVLLVAMLALDVAAWPRSPEVVRLVPGHLQLLAFGMFLCQTLTATLFDSHYARRCWRSLILAPLYPLYFLVLTLPTSLVGWWRGATADADGRWQRTERDASTCIVS